MNTMRNLIHTVVDRLNWLPGFLTRLTLGFIFIQSGWGKLTHLDKVVQFFTQLGIPAPTLQAPFVAGVEFICGLLMLLGLFTRLAAIPLIGTMVVAILTAKLPEVKDFSDFLTLSEYLLILLLVWMAIKGAGSVSLDALLCKKHQTNKEV
jgi:putative oxidoreductase